MPTVLISGLQNRVKNSAAYAEELGIMLIANGEELPYLLTPQGEKIPAGFTAPTVVPTVSLNGAGNIPDTKWIVYVYAYVSENSFPLVAAKLPSNPSPLSTPFQITGGDMQTLVTVSFSDNPYTSHIYLYRTAPQTTSDLALTAAQAGLLNYVNKVANTATTGTTTIGDNLATAIGNDVIDYTNFTAPQFRFVVWDGAYFWGFGNMPFRAQAIWQTDGSFTLVNTSADKFFGGRDNQFLTFDTVHTGGIDNRGTYLFKQTGDYTGQAILEDGSNATLPSAVSGNIVIVGQTANLYRSAYRNPFAWGYSQNIGGVYVPSLWQLKISGALGTAIAVIPDQQLLKLDMEFPALCLTYSLQTASTDVFAQTRRQVSRLHSVTSHFSQFPAIANGRQVLWGMDFKNLAIVQCDGYTQVPVSGPISVLLRQLSKNRALHLMSHGIYDPETEINAIWLSSSDVGTDKHPFNFDLCVYQHAPTGYWGVFSDYGILCSAAVEDPISSKRNILVGTENGFLGKAFDPEAMGNWLPANSIWSGQICAATTTTITRSEGQDDFNPIDYGLIGNYCIVVDNTGLIVQIRKITNATGDTLTFDTALNPVPPTTAETGTADQSQWKFYIGLIELRVLKYFDSGEPATDKAPREYWATLANAENPAIEFYPEHSNVPNILVALKRDNTLDAWFNKLDFPTSKKKTFGMALVERSYNPTEFFNFTWK